MSGQLSAATLARLNRWPNWMVLPDPGEPGKWECRLYRNRLEARGWHVSHGTANPKSVAKGHETAEDAAIAALALTERSKA
jgi:hypothetical protein